LVGNPYPSAIDAVAYIHDLENSSVINGTLYYWEQDPTINSHYIDDYDGGYATYTISSDGSIETYVPAVFYRYNGDGSINALGSGSASGKIPERYIPIGQGFMVEGYNNGVVRAKNAHRVYVKESSGSTFFRSHSNNQDSEIYELLSDNSSRLRFNVTFNDSYTRQIVQTFTPTATLNFDYGLESINNDLLSKDAFFSDSEFNYIAQANNFNINLQIPVKFTVDETTVLALNLVNTINFEDNQAVYLYDALYETYVNLRDNIFEIALDAGEYSNRFYIVFNNNSLNIDEEDENNFSFKYSIGSDQLIISNPKNLFISNITIYDILGKEIERISIKSHSTLIKKNLLNISYGSYIAECKLNDNRKKTLKFIKH